MSTTRDPPGSSIAALVSLRRPASEDDWADELRRLLRREMTRRSMTYEELSARLKELGVGMPAVNIRNRVARGRFTAVFLAQCLTAMGVRFLRVGAEES